MDSPRVPMGSSCQLLLLGDLSVGFEDRLGALLHLGDNPLLSSFLEQVGARVRDDLGRLSTQRQRLFPRFTTLVDLVSKLGETEGTPVLRFCLLTVCQVGEFLDYYSRHGRQYPSPEDTYCLGVCAGSFAAAAISCSRSLSELVPLGVEASVAALRTALCSFVVGHDMVGTTQRGQDAWSVVVSGGEADVQQTIDTFTRSENLGHTWWPYMSAVTPNHVTLSGPPSVLEGLVASAQLKAHGLPIHSPYHAAHLFSDHVVQHVVESVLASEETHSAYLVVLSPCTGEAETAEDFKELMQIVVKNTLQEQVRWDRMLHVLLQTLQDQGIQQCRLVPLSSNATQLVSTALGRAAIGVQTTKPSQSPQQTNPQHGHFSSSKIAIIGYSGRFPDSASNEAFWALLRAGLDVHREVPPDRFDWKTHYDASGKARNKSRVKYGCWIDEPGLFDARFFNISPREAENMDPAQRLAITTVYEAMEMAGMVPNRTPSTQQDRVGVFFGTTSDDYREVNSGQDIDTYFIPGGNRAFVPGRISYFYRFSGPSLSMDTACSSSFAAIQTACAYLWRGECDTAVAGGTNVITNPDNFVGLDRGHFLTTTGNCNAFDDGASGYCRADAVGSVILKRLEDAQADNDPVFGIIAGATTNHCGQTDSITRPHEGDQTSVFKRIVRHAGVDPLDVSYVEMHGTGTQAGDATEMNSVLSVFVPPGLPQQRVPSGRPLFLGSAKANIGHAESASGVSSLIKVLMMMKHSEIPPHCGIKTKINHNYPLDLAERGVNIASRPTPWVREQACGKRYAFLNNFSAAGGNTAVLLEDAPILTTNKSKDPRTFHLVALSAKTSKSLRANMETLVAHLEANPEVSLSGLAYTTTARRQHHSYRAVAVGNDMSSVLQSLKTKLASADPKTIPPPARLPKVAFVFTGQGAFYRGLARELFVHVSSFRDDVERFDAMARQQGFPGFLAVIQSAEAGEADSLVVQLAMTSAQMALSRLWKAWGVQPSLAIGHSLGEYAALFAADVLSASDAIFLVGSRAQLLKKHCQAGTHAMLAVKATEEAVRALMTGSSAEIACLNQPTSNVVSGTVAEMDRLRGVFKEAGHDTASLDVPYAFHSSQVEPMLAEFEALARTVTFKPPSVPYVSPLLCSVVSEAGTLDAAYLTQACRRAVNFKGALEAASLAGLVDEKTLWLEMGPHPVCSGMVKGTLGSNSTTTASLRKDTDAWKVITSTLETLHLAGIAVDWNEYHRDFERRNAVVELPRYGWDLKNYWITYRNDFCLTKGDAVQPVKEVSTLEGPKTFKYLSPSLQRVVEEAHGDAESSILVESDVHDAKLLPVFTGHRVNGAQLCPSSLWGDIVFHLATYFMQQRSMDTKSTAMDICSMVIDKPLVCNPSLTSQLFRISATTDWSSNCVNVCIFSVNAHGKKTLNHATCVVRLEPASTYTSQWKRNAYLIQSRISALRQSVHQGDAHVLKPSLVYRLFANIVEYDAGYRGMREVVLDSDHLEATATVQFQVDEQGFCFNPMWMDSVGGVAGFIMNGGESPHPQAEVYINHGWDSFKCLEVPEFGKTYQTYNRMQLREGTLYAGDTYVFDGERIIAVIEQIKFLGVPRRALDGLRPAGSKPSQLQPTPQTQPTPKQLAPKPALKHKPAPLPISKAPQPPPPASIWLGILAVISEEVGVDLNQLTPDTEFAELGLDSLLSLTIVGRVREELDLDLAPNVFVECPTVKDLQHLHGGSDLSTPASTAVSSSEGESGASTPGTSPSLEKDDGLDHVHILRSTVSEETGIPLGDLGPSTRLDEIGVDSLLALTTMGRLAEAFEVDLPPSLFAESETLSEIEQAISAVLGINATPSIPTAVAAQLDNLQDPVVTSPPHATSIPLQGSPKTATSTLFLFPDGSGSASSYASMSRIGPDVLVYGLNCPWRTTPEAMALSKCTLPQLAAKFVVELRRRQPSGPYHLGGWSAGGICAFEAARQLVSAGHAVDSLVLIDSPNPIGLQNPPARMYDFFQELGIFGGGSGSGPKWLRGHFDAFIGMLDAYEPTPWPSSSLGPAPKTLVVYATDGVCPPDGPRPEIRPDDPREMVWLLNERTDFSADGWRSLLGRERVEVEVLKGVHHFSMMDAGPQMDKMCAYIKKVGF